MRRAITAVVVFFNVVLLSGILKAQMKEPIWVNGLQVRFFITRNEVGPFTLGRSVYTDVFDVFKGKEKNLTVVVKETNGIPVMFVVVYLDKKEPSLLIEAQKSFDRWEYHQVTDDVIGSIRVLDDRFSIDGEIRIGTSFGKFKSIFNTFKVDCADCKDGMAVVNAPLSNMDFEFSFDKKLFKDSVENEPFELPEEAKIMAITVYR